MGTTIHTAADLSSVDRCVVRTSGGTIYVVLKQTTNNRIAVFKSSDGSSWAEQDTANAPTNSAYSAPSAAIDSTGVIHIVYVSNVSMSAAMRYVKFATSTDTFTGDEQIASASQGITTSIAVDASDKPHVCYSDSVTSMGSTKTTVYYTNKTGASWSSPLEILGITAGIDATQPSLIIAKNSGGTHVPQLVLNTSATASIRAYIGNALNATSFTEQSLATGGTYGRRTSMFCDSTGDNTWAAWASAESAKNLYTMKHVNSNAWSTWDSAVLLENGVTMSRCAGARNGSDNRVLGINNSDLDVYVYKNTDSPVDIETGSSNELSVKFARYNDNGSSTQLDYVYRQGTTVLWNKITLSAVTEISVTDTFAGAEAVTRPNRAVGTIGDALAGAESVTRPNRDVATLPETFNFAESVLKGRDVPAIAETFSGAEQVDVAKDKPVADAFAGSDAVEAVRGVEVTDALAGIEAVTRPDRDLSVTDAMAGADVVTRPERDVAVIPDALSGSEAVEVSILAEKEVTDSMSGSEAVEVEKPKVVTDTLSGSEAVTRPERDLTVTDALSGIESVTRPDRDVAPIAEALGGSDDVLKGRDLTVTDAMGGSETVTRPDRDVSTATDTMSSSENVTRPDRDVAVIGDTMLGTEVVTRPVRVLAAIQETVLFDDTGGVTKGRELVVTDIVTFSEEVTEANLTGGFITVEVDVAGIYYPESGAVSDYYAETYALSNDLYYAETGRLPLYPESVSTTSLAPANDGLYYPESGAVPQG